jgi:hypothetical protein
MKQRHQLIMEDIKPLDWVWGTFHTLIKANPQVTIGEVLGQEHFWECRMEGCYRQFQSERALHLHFTQIHSVYTQEGWKISAKRLMQEWAPVIQETSSARDGRDPGRPDERNGQNGQTAPSNAGDARVTHQNQAGGQLRASEVRQPAARRRREGGGNGESDNDNNNQREGGRESQRTARVVRAATAAAAAESRKSTKKP